MLLGDLLEGDGVGAVDDDGDHAAAGGHGRELGGLARPQAAQAGDLLERGFGVGVDPTDPLQNLDGGARYLATQLNSFGRIDFALAAYNAGPGNVQKYVGIPPFEETQNYVRRIAGDANVIAAMRAMNARSATAKAASSASNRSS